MKSIKNKKQTAPQDLTDAERILLGGIYLPDWQFDSVIKPHCILVGKTFITYDNEKEMVWAHIYGLLGQNVETKEQLASCFFIKVESLVYHATCFDSTKSKLELLRKEMEFDLYEDAQFKKGK